MISSAAARTVAERLGIHVWSPVGSDQDGVGLGRDDRAREPARYAPRKIGQGDSWTVRPRREARGMIGDSEHRQPRLAGLQRGMRPCAAQVRSGTHPSDAGAVEVIERVEQGVVAVVERVVVSERHAVDAQMTKDVDRVGRCAEEELLAGSPPRSPPRGDAALEIQDEEIGRARHLDDLRGEQRLRRCGLESLGDAAAQHRVAGQRELHGRSVTDLGRFA